MSAAHRPGIADLGPRRPPPAAEGLELVRLGQLGVLHDGPHVLFAPYMITVPARPRLRDADETCSKTVNVLGLHLAAGLAALLPDQLRHDRQRVRAAGRRRLRRPFGPQEVAHGGLRLGRLRSSASLLFFMQGDHWQIGAVAVVTEQHPRRLLAGAYYAILVDISTEDERDQASSRGWAFGYLGGGLLLADQPRYVPRARRLRTRRGHVGAALAASAGLWWALFTLIPLRPAARLRAGQPWWSSPAACCSAASGSSSPPSGAARTTR